MDSRQAILGRLGRGESARPADGGAVPQRPEALRAQFIERAQAAQCTIETVPSAADIEVAVTAFMRGQDIVGPVIMAPDVASIVEIDGAVSGLAAVDPAADGMTVLAGCIGGVAETGTVAVASGAACDPRLSYLAETLIVVLPVERIVAQYEDIWSLARRSAGRGVPRLVSFITGPSRTADIEQTIEFGAHGARRMHIVLVEQGL